ncbi:putative phage gene [Salmonella enterica subsp. arizonae]|uniref:Putative phage protein n=1 Tax=Salmonella enterica subsp. arizonae TaxID=59203 RepID=A0A3S4JXK7_SALER|nr:putative phage gene [Salmonella enterica subsp. arizonae]
MNLKPGYSKDQDTDAATGVLKNDGFWPDLVLADFRRSRTIPLDIPASLAEQALLSAVFEVNAALAGVKTRYTMQGISQAADVEGPQLNGKSALCAQYEKSVFARAKADLLGEFTAVNTATLTAISTVTTPAKPCLPKPLLCCVLSRAQAV